MGGCIPIKKSTYEDPEDDPQYLSTLDSYISKHNQANQINSPSPLGNHHPSFRHSDSFHSDRSTGISRDSSISDITATLDDFKKLNYIGKGQFSNVFLVQLLTNKKLFAMKVLQKKLILKKNQIIHTQTERILLEKMIHPFLLKLYYAFQDKENLYFITEFMQGGDLLYQIKQNKKMNTKFSEKAVLFYMSEILVAIEYMHKNNLLYRDLKPENILLDWNGHIKLADFGLSKILDDEESGAYTICGTAEYLSPEKIFNSGCPYDKTSDWFSFGVVMYELLTGSHLFPRNNNNTIDISRYEKEIEFPKYISKQAKDLLKKLLCKNPEHRLGKNGAKEIKKHPFFRNVDFDLVLQKLYIPPFIPKLRDEFDLSYFEDSLVYEPIDSATINKDNYFSYSSSINDVKFSDSFEMFEGFSYQPSDNDLSYNSEEDDEDSFSKEIYLKNTNNQNKIGSLIGSNNNNCSFKKKKFYNESDIII